VYKKLSILFLALFLITQFQQSRFAKDRIDPAISVLSEVRVSPASDPDPRNEPALAVSPINPQFIVGASRVITGGGNGVVGNTRVAYYSSSDGGRTWATTLLTLETPQKTWGRCSDPYVIVDTNGVFYLLVLLLDNSNFDSGIYLFSSIDNGRTFANPIPVTFDIGSGSNPKQVDKCLAYVDTANNSPFKNSVYVVWTVTDRGTDNQNRAVIKLAYKRANEAAFSASKTISHEGDMRGPSVATGPNGEVYAAWEGIGNPKVILFNASTDGGNTFLPPDAAPSIDLNIHNFTGSLDRPSPALILNGVDRMNSFPIIDVDRSNGANRGMIYVAYTETINRTDADIFVKRLTPPNGGRPEVSAPVKINSDASGADQFFPWLSVDQSSGAVVVAFYDRREESQPFMNTYVARSTDGGLTFSDNTRVTSTRSDPTIQARVTNLNGTPVGIGDYIGLAALNGKAHLMWTDTRNQKQEIYYGAVEYVASGGGGGGNAPPNDLCTAPRSIAALPFSDTMDTRTATTAPDDPATCAGASDANSVWYSFTASSDTVYGVDTVGSDYDTVLSVYSGSCGGLTRVACSDDFGSAIAESNRSVLTFAARAGTTYLIEVSGKGSGGNLKLRIGYPTITGIEYTLAPDGSEALRITGAGFIADNIELLVQRDGEDTPLNKFAFTAARQGDGTYAEFFGWKKKLKKLIKPNRTVIVRVVSPAASNRVSVLFTYRRPSS